MKIYIFVVKLWVENFLFCPDKNLAKSPNDLAARISLHMSESKKVEIFFYLRHVQIEYGFIIINFTDYNYI